MFAPQAQAAVAAMREVCLALPESSEDTQFGKPVWRAGKKVFAQCYAYRDAPVRAAFWVGVDRQGLMTMDPRFSIPAYLGPGGWIALDVAQGFDLDELRSLALESYRHYASKRMLAALDPAPAQTPERASARTTGARRAQGGEQSPGAIFDIAPAMARRAAAKHGGQKKSLRQGRRSRPTR